MALRFQFKRTRPIPEWKKKEVEELVRLIKSYKVIAIGDLTGFPAAQLHKIRKRLREKYGEDKIKLRVAKNTLFKLALKRAGLPVEKFEPYLTGTNIFIFANINPFELAKILEKERARLPAKPGMKAESEIVVPAGNTGLQPGPIMSVFSKLRIPIRVQGGTIWIAKDTVVAKPGDVISEELASLLQKLGIEPFEIYLKLKMAYEDGLVIPSDQLYISIDEYRKQVEDAVKHALWLGVEMAYPEPEVLKLALPLAVRRAMAVAAEAGYVTPETAEFVIRSAVAKALAIVAALGDKAKELGIEVQVAAAPAPAAEEKEEKREEGGGEGEEEKKEGVSEEELAGGLESLFGF